MWIHWHWRFTLITVLNLFFSTLVGCQTYLSLAEIHSLESSFCRWLWRASITFELWFPSSAYWSLYRCITAWGKWASTTDLTLIVALFVSLYPFKVKVNLWHLFIPIYIGLYASYWLTQSQPRGEFMPYLWETCVMFKDKFGWYPVDFK